MACTGRARCARAAPIAADGRRACRRRVRAGGWGVARGGAGGRDAAGGKRSTGPAGFGRPRGRRTPALRWQQACAAPTAGPGRDAVACAVARSAARGQRLAASMPAPGLPIQRSWRAAQRCRRPAARGADAQWGRRAPGGPGAPNRSRAGRRLTLQRAPCSTRAGGAGGGRRAAHVRRLPRLLPGRHRLLCASRGTLLRGGHARRARSIADRDAPFAARSTSS